MRINWFATTALAAILSTGAAWAQSAEPQGAREKAAPHAQQERATKPQDGAAQNAQRSEDRAGNERGQESSSAAQRAGGESKGKAREEQAPGRAQANEPAAKRDSMSQKGSAQDAEEKRASETKQPASKQPSAQRGTESRNAREEGARQKGQEKGQAKAPEQRPSGQAQGTAGTKQGKESPSTAQSKQPGQNQGTAQSKQGTEQNKQGSDTAKNAQPGTGATPRNTTAQGQSGQTTQQQTSTASAKLSETDRSKVISTLQQDRASTRDQINVQVNVGERLPPRIRPRPLPSRIVQIMPEYRGYDYVSVRDEVYIVRPGTREVVDVIREGGPSYARGETRGTTHVRLTDDQRQILLREARPMTSAQVSSQGPTCLPMQPVPESLASQNPDLRGYQMLAVGSDVVLIDPKDQKVVDVIRQ